MFCNDLVISHNFKQNFTGTLSGFLQTNLEITLPRDDFSHGEVMIKNRGVLTTQSLAVFVYFDRIAANSNSVSAFQNYQTLRWSPTFYSAQNIWRVGGFFRNSQDRLSRDMIFSSSGASTDDRHIADCFMIDDVLRIVIKNESFLTWNYNFQVIGRVYKGDKL